MPTTYVSNGSNSDVQAKVNLCVAGDTVTIPAGTFPWTSTISINKNITLIGAGKGATIITNNSPSSPIFGITVQNSSTLSRLSGMTLNPGGVGSITNNFGAINISGQSPVPNFRIDNIAIPNAWTAHIFFDGGLTGVVDHCDFDTDHFAGCLYPRHSSWKNVGNWGDNSWADDPLFGTDQAIFIENCTFDHFDAATMLDGVAGCRVVLRNSTIRRSNIGNHGTDTSGRQRGGRVFEVYNNQFLGDFPNTIAFGGYEARAVYFRSGTGVVWGNTISRYNIIAQLAAYRKWGAGLFPVADGTSPWDSNSSTLYASGTHTGANGATTLTDSTKTWTASQWLGYSLVNLDAPAGTQHGCEIVANTATTIDTFTGAGYARVTFNTGNHYEIRKVNIVLDQPARGKGDLISGIFSDNTISPVAWPHQALEPIYVWSNTWTDRGNGTPPVSMQNSQLWASGTDWFYSTGTSGALPGYVPFVYPHPLVSGAPVNPPAISSPLTASATVAVAFSYQIAASNGPTSFGASPLPPGLSVNLAGLISGTPTVSGIYNVTISATNSSGTGSAILIITVHPAVVIGNPPVITSPLTASGIQNTAFTYQIVATNTPTSYNATGLPAGLAVNSGTGLVSGVPTAVAVTNVTISATNAQGTASGTLVITITAAAPTPVGRHPKRWKNTLLRRRQ